MENTISNKERFFALYWGQFIGRQINISFNYSISSSNLRNIEDDYLELKSLSSISEEDAVAIGFLGARNFHSCVESYGFEKVFNTMISHYGIDYLRSKSYLVGFNGLTPEQILSYGWARLTA